MPVPSGLKKNVSSGNQIPTATSTHPVVSNELERAVGLPATTREIAQEVSEHDDGNADPQRPNTSQPDRAPLALVVADALVAVATRKPR